MFNLSDKTFLRVPAMMAHETAAAVIDLVDRHLSRHGSPPFQVVLHGGEPTLWPTADFQHLLERVDALCGKHARVKVSLQTNGVMLRPALVRLLALHRVSIGISLDGPKPYNDQVRVDHCGRGSYDKVIRTVTALLDQEGQGNLIGGFLAVAQPQIPPLQFLDWIARLPVPRVDVLWPIEFNYDNPPWSDVRFADYIRKPRYGHWFATLFEHWWRRDDPEIYIRHFYDILERMAGSKVHTDAIGNDMLNMFVVNTDGGIEYPDYFRAYRDGGARTPFNVFEHDLDEILADEVFSYCLNMGQHQPVECRKCPHLHVCGGGFLPGRMATGETVPLRKSVLCYDHYYFLSRVAELAAPYLAKSTALGQSVNVGGELSAFASQESLRVT